MTTLSIDTLRTEFHAMLNRLPYGAKRNHYLRALRLESRSGEALCGFAYHRRTKSPEAIFALFAR